MNPPQLPSDAATKLNLDRFAPGAEPESQPADPSSEGVTILIKKATAETLRAVGHVAAVPHDTGGLLGRSLLGVLAYCYAKGVYESEAIEAEMRRIPALQQVLPAAAPDAHLIQRFRRHNHDVITGTLERYFSELRHRRAAAAPEVASSGDTTLIAHQQAVSKLGEAIVMDTLADED
jgi:hypothetical protein